ncbi:MAG TPA: hypothetical protein PLJ21_02945, partial [Pseudobdellovibrionaceae bacterium]|nr:hypothetical protein [Pseudobdellovibrionaceae bacterium]
MKNPRVFLKIFIFIFIFILGNSFLEASEKNKETSVELVWEEIPEASLYELEVFNLSKKLLKTVRQNQPTFVLELPLGQYLARMRVADERKVFGVWSEMSEFLVSLQTPKFLNEKPIQVLPDPKTLQAVVSVRWEKSPLATGYRVEIFDEAGKLAMSKQVRSSSVRLNLAPGVYHYQVIALTEGGEESAPQKEKQTIAVDRPQLDSPIFEESSTIEANSNLRWKVHPKSVSKGTLEYLPFLATTWNLVKDLNFENEQL